MKSSIPRTNSNSAQRSADLTRRHFLASLGAGAAAIALPGQVLAAHSSPGPFRGRLCFFSKPLPEMDWETLAKNVRQVGFDGVDLTVRAGGHVKPERAAQDLPRAVAAIRNEGLDVPMITTALTSADDPTARPILSAAGKLSIPYFKPGYYMYKLVDVRDELEKAGQDFVRLAEIAKQFGVQAGYHNHEEYVGAPVWDMARVIDPLDPRWVGFYFDPRHAVAEGGVGGWKIALNLVLPRLKMVAVKDFYWEKTSAKGWQAVNCPLGQGMVDWKYFFKTIAAAGFHGPISLHLEYEIGGATQAAKQENILAATHRDLEYLKARVGEAYEKS